MKYKITLTESNKGSVIVEALNKEHAIDKVMEAYHNGNIDWEYALPTVSKVELIKESYRGGNSMINEIKHGDTHAK